MTSSYKWKKSTSDALSFILTLTRLFPPQLLNLCNDFTKYGKKITRESNRNRCRGRQWAKMDDATRVIFVWEQQRDSERAKNERWELGFQNDGIGAREVPFGCYAKWLKSKTKGSEGSLQWPLLSSFTCFFTHSHRVEISRIILLIMFIFFISDI